jgi:FkbM family methyltransferase
MGYTKLNVPANCQIENLEKIYNELFPDLSDGTFVEVGAYDGENFSNTSCLSDVGWGGIYVEPITPYFDLCQKRHGGNPKVSCVNCAVGTEETFVQLNFGITLSTLCKEYLEAYNQMAWSKGFHQGHTIEVSQYRLETILKAADMSPGFELLVVDVEGNELEVVSSFDIDYWKPKVMIIEIEDEHEDLKKFPLVVEKCRKVRSLVESHGYKIYYKNFINSVYVKAA